jgi:hypothetical protein
VGMGSVEERVEELEGRCCCCVECKMRIAGIARKRKKVTRKGTVEALWEEIRELELSLGVIEI